MCNGGYRCALVKSMKLDSANVVVDLLRAKFSRLSGLFKEIIGTATINKVKFWCSKQTTCLRKCYAIHTALAYFTEVCVCSEAPHTRLGCARLSGEFSYSSLNADCLQKIIPNYPEPKLPRSTLYRDSKGLEPQPQQCKAR